MLVRCMDLVINNKYDAKQLPTFKKTPRNLPKNSYVFLSFCNKRIFKVNEINIRLLTPKLGN